VKEKFLDPALVERLEQQVDGKSASLDGKAAKVRALDTLIAALERNRVLGGGKARNKVQLYEAALAAAVLDSAVEQARFRAPRAALSPRA